MDWLSHPRRQQLFRIWIFAAALLAFALSLVVENFDATQWKWLHDKGGPGLRYISTALAMLWTLIDLIITRHQAMTKAVSDALGDQADSLMASLERMCHKANTPSKVFECSVAIWRVQPRSRKERRNKIEAKLEPIYKRKMRNKIGGSHVVWRVGKGVIGLALQNMNRTQAVEVEKLWSPLRKWSNGGLITESQWDQIPQLHIRQNLTYKEFKQLLGSHGPISVGAPTIFVVPLAHPDTGHPVGCAALDVPASMGPALLANTQDVLAPLDTMLTTAAELLLK